MAALIGILVIAFFAGVFGSMLGVGGGVIMVPVLSLAFGVPIKTAIATSIVCVIATSSMAQITFAARGMTNMRLGMFLEVATTVGAIAGGITAILVDGRFLQVAFACVLFYVAWQMGRRKGDIVPVEGPVMPASYYDPAEDREIGYGVHGLGIGFALSFVAGNVSGLLGVGGGRLQGADHEPAHGRPAQGDHRHQQPHDRRDRRHQRRHLLRARLHGPALGGAGGARHPRRRALRAPARHPPAHACAAHRLRDRAAGVRRAHDPQGCGGGWMSSDRRAAAPRHQMDPVERLVRRILLTGIVLAVALMAAGLVLSVVDAEGLPAYVVPLADLPAQLAALDPAAYLSLGVIVLIGTPFVRVAGSIVVFVRQRDRRYVLITAVVLAVMCLSVLLGKA